MTHFFFYNQLLGLDFLNSKIVIFFSLSTNSLTPSSQTPSVHHTLLVHPIVFTTSFTIHRSTQTYSVLPQTNLYSWPFYVQTLQLAQQHLIKNTTEQFSEVTETCPSNVLLLTTAKYLTHHFHWSWMAWMEKGWFVILRSKPTFNLWPKNLNDLANALLVKPHFEINGFSLIYNHGV